MRLIDADALKRKYEDNKRLFCRNRIEFSILSDKDKARVDELDNCIAEILNAPTIEPEPSIPISWIERHIDWLKDMDNGFANITAMNIETMLRKWREEQNEAD